MGFLGPIGDAVKWATDNPFTTGGAVAGGILGGPVGAVAGGYGGSILDSSGNPDPMAGFGMQENVPFVEYNTPGLQPGDPTGYSGVTDFTKAGMGEQAAANVQNWSPEYATGAWETANPYFQSKPYTSSIAESSIENSPTNARTTQYAGQEYQNFERPDLMSTEAGLDPYYDNAKRRAAESINQQAAARGSFASSAAQDMVNEAFTNLEAEKAGQEADYALKRAAEQRAWEGLGGELASSADLSSRGNAATQMDWLTGRTGLATAADEQERLRMKDFLESAMGMDEVSAAQVMRELEAGTLGQKLGEGRSNQLFDNTMRFSDATDRIMGPMYNDMARTDQDLLNQTVDYNTGLAALGRDESQRNTDQIYRDMQTAYEVARDQGWL
jgi:hypothetical protein